jgi:hypothetical protein
MEVSMKNIINYLEKDRVRILFIVLFIIFAFIISPIVLILSDQYTNISFSPDISFFYSPEAFYETLIATGKSGRTYYFITTWTFDLLYPLVYGFTILSAMIKFSNHKKSIIYMVPLIGIIFDYLENSLASLLALFYKTEINFLVYILQFFSSIKWLSIGLSILIIIILAFKNHKKNIISQSE